MKIIINNECSSLSRQFPRQPLGGCRKFGSRGRFLFVLLLSCWVCVGWAQTQPSGSPLTRLRYIDSSDFLAEPPLREIGADTDPAFPPWSGALLRFDAPESVWLYWPDPAVPERPAAFPVKPMTLVFAEDVGTVWLGDDGDTLWRLDPDRGGPPEPLGAPGVLIRDLVGLTLHPHSGELALLDRGGARLLRVLPGPEGAYAGAHRGRRLSSLRLHAGPLRGLAYNPADGGFYSIDADTGELLRLGADGRPAARHPLVDGPRVVRAFAFAPSSDRTDAADAHSLYILGAEADGYRLGEWATPGAARVAQRAQLMSTASLLQRIDTSSYPSPDPAGIAYRDDRQRLILSDSEVNEIPSLFNGNLFELSASDLSDGATPEVVTDTLDFSEEPTGLAYDEISGDLFISDDDYDEVFRLQPGRDGDYGTADDRISSFDTRAFGSYDPEGLAFDSARNVLYIADGNNSEIYRISAGADGVFDGGDDQVESFDSESLGVSDPEGIAYDAANDLLYLIGEPKNLLAHVSGSGALVRLVDIAAASAYNPAGMTLAPNSADPSRTSLYIVDRAVDNNIDPDENDGRVYEMSIPPLSLGNRPPVVVAGADRTVRLGGELGLSASVSDDGLPEPGVLSLSWGVADGPGAADFDPPDSAATTASFAAAGVYRLELTADDGEFRVSDGLTVTVLASEPGGVIYISTEFDGQVGGVSYADEDVIAYQDGVWSLYFDGSDVGLGSRRQEIDALHVDADGSILFSLRYQDDLPGLGAVDDSDILRFVPSALGQSTSGSYQWVVDGSDVELSGDGEDIDAIGFTADGRLVVSTNGFWSTADAYGNDDDLLVFDAVQFGADTVGSWSRYLDGAAVGLGDSSEDLAAVSIDGSGEIRLATRGGHQVGTLNGDGSDILSCTPLTAEAVSGCVWTLFWSGAEVGFNNNIKGLSISP